MSNCKCFAELLEKITEDFKSQLSEKEAATLTVEWKNASLFLQGNSLASAVTLPVSYEYQKFKKSGEPHKHTARGQDSLLMSYCPLCGEKIKKESDKEAA
jgi:hypothetical protein